jgi:hypothetical protein
MKHPLPLLLLLSAIPGCRMSTHHVPIGDVAETVPDAAGIERIEIGNPVGSIRIEPGREAEVVIRAEVLLEEQRAADRAPDPLRFADHVRVTRDGARLAIGSAHAGAEDAGDWQLRMVVTLPPERALEIDLDVGEIQVTQPKTKDLHFDVGVGAARIAVGAVAGALNGRVSTGELRAEIGERVPSGGTDLSVGVGELELRLPDQVEGSFTADVGVGDLKVADRLGLATDREITRMSARGRIRNDDPRHRLSVGTGDLRIR